MIYKTTSVKRVIAKVFTDLDLQEGEHRISDMVEWAGEALEKIGAFPQFINKVSGKDGLPLLTVTNYQTSLPCDFHRLIQIAYSTTETGPFYTMRYATGSFDYGSTATTSDTTDPTYPESALVSLAMDLYSLTYPLALAYINANPSIRSLLNSLLAQAGSHSTLSTDEDDLTDTTIDYTYLINDSYIKTNQETGYIMLAYQAIPTDNEGYPMVPDDQSFFEALYWYIVMKLYYPQWKLGTVRDAVYYDARRSWNYYCKQAYGNALMPDKGQLESIKNTWLRLVPEINEYSTSFSTLGERQNIYDAN